MKCNAHVEKKKKWGWGALSITSNHATVSMVFCLTADATVLSRVFSESHSKVEFLFNLIIGLRITSKPDQAGRTFFFSRAAVNTVCTPASHRNDTSEVGLLTDGPARMCVTGFAVRIVPAFSVTYFYRAVLFCYIMKYQLMVGMSEQSLIGGEAIAVMGVPWKLI